MDMKQVDSTLIESIGYDSVDKILQILFKSGKSYTYANVPETAWQDMIMADSVGSFFLKNIKGKYETLLHNPEL